MNYKTKPYWEKDLFLFQKGIIVMLVLFITRGIGAKSCFDGYFDDHSSPITGFVMYLKLLAMFFSGSQKKLLILVWIIGDQELQ